MQWSDPQIWGEQGDDCLAGYVHGLAVRRSASGKNLGHSLLTLAAGLTAQKPRPFLRLDGAANNDRLCRYYRDAGFEPVRVNEVIPNQLYIQLFQKPQRISLAEDDPSITNPPSTIDEEATSGKGEGEIKI
jgi:hypothetical protein